MISMMTITFRYIFKKLVNSLLVIAPIIVLLVWLTISIRYINLIVTEDISITTFFRVILCYLPDISSVILPICALISSITIFYKMQADKEVLILKTSGKSKFSIAAPLLVFSIIISILVLFLQSYITPYAYKNLINIQQKIQSQISMAIVKPGVFNTVGESVIYIREKTNDSLSDVFISYIPKDKRTHRNIITAKKGKYIVTENGLFISLDQGYRQEIDENNNAISALKFDNFSYDVTEFIKKYSKKVEKPYEKTQKELFEEGKKSKDKKLKRRYAAEYHSRLLTPLIPIINSLIVSIFMMHAYIRNRNMIQAIKTFLLGIVCQVSIMTLANSAANYEFLISLNYSIIAVIIVVLLFISFKRKSK